MREIVLRYTASITLVMVLGLTALGPVLHNLRAAAADCAAPGSAPYLHTCGTQIVDAAGAPLRLRGVNWYGFDSNDFVAGGLRYAPYQAIVARIKSLGFNTLRIPFSNQLVEQDPIVSTLGPLCAQLSCLRVYGADLLGPNAALYGRDALTILKTIVDYAGQQGLYVILDDHRSQAAWDLEPTGLWYTSLHCAKSAQPYSCYTPQSWLDDWTKIGRLFQNDPYLTGVDLRNEVRSTHQPSTCQDYVTYAHWGPCGGYQNNATDWPQAATQAGNALLALNPHWLIAVEGVSTYPQSNGSFPQDGGGENLQGVATDPISLAVPNQVIYSPHDYRWVQPNDTVQKMYDAWTRNFGFIATPGAPYAAPLWLGEFGTCTHANDCFNGTVNGNQSGWWFNALMTYLDNPPNGMAGPLSWSLWSINGTVSDGWSHKNLHSPARWQNCYGQREDFGVLGSDWSTVAAPALLMTMFRSDTPSPTNTPANTATWTPTNTPTGTSTSTTTPAATATVSQSLTLTATATVSATMPATLTATATLTGTTPQPTASITATGTATISPTATITASATATPAVSATVTVTATATTSATPTVTTTTTVTTTSTVSATTTTAASTVTPTTVTLTATNTASPTATRTAVPTPTTDPTLTASATATGATTPGASPSATPTNTPSSTATATSTPSATATLPPVVTWPTVACAAYSITPTATPAPLRSPTAPPTATLAPLQSPTVTPTPVRSRLTMHIKPAVTHRHGAPSKAIVTALGHALHRVVVLDVLLRRDSRGHLSGWLRFADRRHQLRLTAVSVLAATTMCGRSSTASVAARLVDASRRHRYDATLGLLVKKGRPVQFSMRLGRGYVLNGTLVGRASITCAPPLMRHRRTPTRR